MTSYSLPSCGQRAGAEEDNEALDDLCGSPNMSQRRASSGCGAFLLACCSFAACSSSGPGRVHAVARQESRIRTIASGRPHEQRAGMRISVLVVVLSIMAGCVSMAASSPVIVRQLKLVSAGHTGCLADENEISNVNASPDGSGTWNATCKGKVYLCSAVASVGNSESYSCAPVAN